MLRYVMPTLLLLVAGALQGNMPEWMMFKGARPDLLLVVVIALSLTFDPLSGAIIGFFAGLIHGSIVGVHLGSYIVSRAVIGFAAGSMTVRLFSDNALVPVVAAGGLTFAGELLFLIFNPIPNFVGSIKVLLAESLYNSLLALLTYWIIRRVQLARKIRMAAARL